MKKHILIILSALLMMGFTACDEISQDELNNAPEIMEESGETADELVDIPLTAEMVIAANDKENIYKLYKSVVITEHDMQQDRVSTDYYSERVNCKQSDSYFYYMSEDIMVGSDPDDNVYGIIHDKDSFKEIYDSYLLLNRTDYSAMELTLNDDNTLTAVGEYEDYYVSYNPDNLLYNSVTVKNKDGSDWIIWEYEYSGTDKDTELRGKADEIIADISAGEKIVLTIDDDGNRAEYSVPKGFTALIYSDDYYKLQDTDEYYYNQVLNEDIVLVLDELSEEG